MKPGQFFVLKFDFSAVQKSLDATLAGKNLLGTLFNSFIKFYSKYSKILGGDVENLIEPNNLNVTLQRCVRRVNDVISEGYGKDGTPLTNAKGVRTDCSLTHFTWLILKLNSILQIYLLVDEYDSFSNDYLEPGGATWEGEEVAKIFESFWRQVKALLSDGIQRTFITGVSPLSFAGIASAFNVSRDVSFDPDLAGLCGLTHSDVQAALEILCPESEAYEKHLSSMTRYFNGFHFCGQRKVEPVYNTDSCLGYLQVRIGLSFYIFVHCYFQLCTKIDVIIGTLR